MDPAVGDVLLELREHTLAKGKEFKLLNVTKLVQKVFAITRLNSVFEILSERGVALAASPGRPPVILKAACA